MNKEAVLTQLGYVPNEALINQLNRIENNTIGYEKIQKHIMDLHDHLKVHNSYVALSNSEDHFKIKIEDSSEEVEKVVHEKVQRFSQKFKVSLNKLENKNTYYILGFQN